MHIVGTAPLSLGGCACCEHQVSQAYVDGLTSWPHRYVINIPDSTQNIFVRASYLFGRLSYV